MSIKVRCLGCSKYKLLTPDNFPWNAVKNAYATTKRCNECLAEERRAKRKLKREGREDIEGEFKDWAWLFRTFGLKAKFKDTPYSATQFSFDDLRAIMALQLQTCPVFEADLVLPQDVSRSGFPYKSWQRWVEALEPHDRNLVPNLVRIDQDGPWKPGNVIFISMAALPWYNAGKDLEGMMTGCIRILRLDGPYKLDIKPATAEEVETYVMKTRIQRSLQTLRPTP